MAKSKHDVGEESLGLLGEERNCITKKLQNLAKGVWKGLKMLSKRGQYRVRKRKLYMTTLSHDIEFNTLTETPRTWASMQIEWAWKLGK